MSNEESRALRERLRTDLFCRCMKPEPNAPHFVDCEWANAVSRVYEIERALEAGE